jgi:hypothetical protein
LKELATQSTPLQATERSGGPPGSVARVQAEAPPVGLLEVTTRPELPTSTHWIAETQSTPNSDFALGILVGVQEPGPPAGSVLVQTPPLKSTATQSEEVGQEIPRRLPRSPSAPTATWPTDQA